LTVPSLAQELDQVSRKKLLASIGLLIAIPALGAAVSQQTVPHEAEFASRSVIYNWVLLTSPSVRKAREHCHSYCGDEGGNVEVAIGLLGVGGRATTQSLLNLLSLRLDAGGSEELSCQIAKRGRALVPALAHLSANRVSSWCGQTFHDLRKQELANISDVPVEQICRPPAEVETDRKEWMAALQSGRGLFAESGPC
jgi:hypothetical protein